MRVKSKNTIYIFLLIFSILQVSCKQKTSQTLEATSTVIVQFEDANFSEKLSNDIVSEFNNYNLAKIEVLSRPLHIYLYSFNEEKIAIDKLIEKLKLKSDIKEAQPNRKVSPRN